MVSRIVKLISNTVSNNSCLSCSKLLKVGALTAADLVGYRHFLLFCTGNITDASFSHANWIICVVECYPVC